MFFAMICKDIEDSLEKRLASREEHREWLRIMKQQGRLKRG